MFNRYGMQRVDHSRTSPAPMPDVRAALIPMKDAKAAIDRALDAWNPTQMQDAIRSAEFFIAQAKQALEVGATREKAAVEDPMPSVKPARTPDLNGRNGNGYQPLHERYPNMSNVNPPPTCAKPPAPPAPPQPHGYHGTHIEPTYPWPR